MSCHYDNYNNNNNINHNHTKKDIHCADSKHKMTHFDIVQ